MNNIFTFHFGTVSVFSNRILVVMNEGISITTDFNDVLQDIATTYFKNKNFVYITHRLHSYSVDPNIYIKTSQIKNLIGFAVVVSHETVRDNTSLEKIFLTKPFKRFEDLDSAIHWANTICNNNDKEALT